MAKQKKQKTILQALMVYNKLLQESKGDILKSGTAKKHLDDITRLLFKGYNLDEYYNEIMGMGKGNIHKVPDPKKAKGQNISARELRELAEKIHVNIPHNHGFGLVIFKYGEIEEANYIGNSDRRDMITIFRQLAEQFEKQKEKPMK